MSSTRLEYRDPKVPKAVCVYTIAQESRYLIIENVPNLGVSNELVERFQQFGVVEDHRILDEHASSSEYTDVHWIKYDTIKAARMAKRKLDDKPFFTNLLRVSYAPEYDTFDDIRVKFQDRLESVHSKLTSSHSSSSKKRRSTSASAHREQETVYIGPIQQTSRQSEQKQSTNQTPINNKKRRRI
ncbi:RNA-binding protein 48-like [Mucor ambiguus]|uniref:RNA-binding protein 48 n=1 Tax=Mucor ambiguus TaxID=91626 RepID=A0A0C9N668_9FUNG|nr:RNA-binding protein 48-like [Mucor ambiguus]